MILEHHEFFYKKKLKNMCYESQLQVFYFKKNLNHIFNHNFEYFIFILKKIMIF